MTDYRWIGHRFLEATNQIFDRAEAYWVMNMPAAVASQDGKWAVSVQISIATGEIQIEFQPGD